MTDVIKVLFLAADPFGGEASLRLDREARTIEDAVGQGHGGVRLEFVPVLAARTRDLQRALQKHAPQVVHFAGHGSASRGIFLEDDAGNARAVSQQALRGLFAILGRSVRVVVLNACNSLPTLEAIRGLMDYAIGMNSRVSDRAAIVFADAFYAALAGGSDVKEAFELGANRLLIEGLSESDTPVLLLREGAVPGPIAVSSAAPAQEPARPGGTPGYSITVDRTTMRDFDVAQGENPVIIRGWHPKD